MSDTTVDELAPTEWLIDDLVTTILDASPEELPELHAKLTALAGSIDTHGLITQAKKDLLAEVREKAQDYLSVYSDEYDVETQVESEAVPLAAIKEIEEGL